MDQQMIPYFCHEGEMARAERTIKRLWILCILLVVLLVGTNIAWIHYENQWETAETVVTQDIDTVNGRPMSDVLPVIDELMTTLQVLHPRLYDGVLNKL